jgi:prepilin-type N-terminal cleavage/methylation domain-containing protein
VTSAYKKGLTLIEMVIAISIISIMLLIVIPTFVKQNEKIQLDTVSEEIINTLQLVQTYAHSTQTEVVVSLNIHNENILQIDTTYPAIKDSIQRNTTKIIPTFIDVKTNIEINKIIFQPNNSWKLYKDTSLVTNPHLNITLENQNETSTIIFYPNSKTIHLLE